MNARWTSGRALLSIATTALAVLLASPCAVARPRDGSGPYRFDGRAINGRYDSSVSAPDQWFSAKPGPYDVTVKLSDVAGNSLAEGSQAFTCGTSSSVCIQPSSVYPFKGRFFAANQDDPCTYFRESSTGIPHVTCWYVYGARLYARTIDTEVGTPFSYSMPVGLSGGKPAATRGYAVGDFDGDGYDEVITYDRATGGSARVWSFDRRTGKFYERPEILGNLAGWQGFSGGGGALMFAGNFNDNDGFARLDDLLVYNETTKQILVLEGRRPGGAYARLWVWYWSVLDVQPYEELSVATFASSASGFDNIVISAWTGQSAGTIRAYSAAWPLTYLPSYQGQIIFRPRDNIAGDVHLVWGDLGAWDPTRDDAIQFIPGKGLYYGFDAHPAGEWYYRFKQGIGYLKASLGL